MKEWWNKTSVYIKLDRRINAYYLVMNKWLTKTVYIKFHGTIRGLYILPRSFSNNHVITFPGKLYIV